jgi:hypothetical protein
LWPFGIGFFVLGLALLVSSITRLIAGAWISAVSFCFLGALILGLSFIRMPVVPKKDDQPLSFLQKLTGIFFEPSRVFQNLRGYPLWIGAFIVMGLLSTIYSYAFIQRITPERIIEHSRRQMENLGSLTPPPEIREARLAQELDAMKSPAQRGARSLLAFPFLFIFIAIGAALGLLGILAFGGRINFWQALAVTMYSLLPVIVIQKVLGLVILYLKEPDDLHPALNRDTTLQDNLSILFSPADHPVLFVLASFIGLTSFYGLWLRAKGLHLGATRASSGAGWGVAIILWLLGVFIATTFAALFPSALS